MKKLSPAMKEGLQTALFAAVGVALIVQPFFLVLRALGWLIVVVAALLAIALVYRYQKTKAILRDEIARFKDGSILLRRGLYQDGTLLDFSTFGMDLTGMAFDGSLLTIEYTFIERGNKRKRYTAQIQVAQDELDLANQAMEQLRLPPIQPKEPEIIDPADTVPRI